jgi:hypothetical protein
MGSRSPPEPDAHQPDSVAPRGIRPTPVALPAHDPSDPGPRSALALDAMVVQRQAALPVRDRRRRLPQVPPLDDVADVERIVSAVNSGAGLWARSGGKIGNSEIHELVVSRPPTPDEVAHGVDPTTPIVKKGYEGLAMLFEHSPLDVQTELYRRLSRSPPWWAWLDVFGWFKGARAPVERFEEEYDPGGNLELFVMGHDQGAWLLPRVFKRWFRFTTGKGDWLLGRDEVTGRGGDTEAARIEDRGYAPSLIKQYQDMRPAERWRALHAVSPDLLDTAIGARLEEIDPTWFDRYRFGVAFLYDADDPGRGAQLRRLADGARRFLTTTLRINPYTVVDGFRADFVPISPRFPEIPSDPVHQLVVDLRRELRSRSSHRLDLIEFAGFVKANFPRWPQLTPEMLERVLDERDHERFIHKQVDLWGQATDVRRTADGVPKVLTWSTRERVGTDPDGNAVYRTRRSRWTAQVPAVGVTLGIRGETDGAITRAYYQRVGDVTATGHYRHVTRRPPELRLRGGVERFHGRLDPELDLIL